MKRTEVIKQLISGQSFPILKEATAFRPINIALCKYWGKRDPELNLPANSSFSLSLPRLGTETSIKVIDAGVECFLNSARVNENSHFYRRITDYLQDFIKAGVISENVGFSIHTKNNIPTSAGLASSASGFAAMITAMNILFGWNLSETSLSILARLGSGSACRSIYNGFVEWKKGLRNDGMDCHAVPFGTIWEDLRLGILTITEEKKEISSRDAMIYTAEHSPFYQQWIIKAESDVVKIKQAIKEKNFRNFGEIAESNALAMHAIMFTSRPPVIYWKPETINTLHKVRKLRENGTQVYYTMDAGPNVKILYLEKDEEEIKETFPDVEVIRPFSPSRYNAPAPKRG